MFNKNKKIKVAINGFGRIGRLFFKMAENNPNLEVVAINDLGDVENMAYLLNYDTAQKSLIEMFGKKADFERGGSENFIVVGKNKIPFFSVKNPSELP
jgi:glyceraldehyde 3-phosphate dehydrogenase